MEFNCLQGEIRDLYRENSKELWQSKLGVSLLS